MGALKANELMIGNYYDTTRNSNVNEWVTWRLTAFSELEAIQKFPEAFRPTEITGEMLIVLGFEKYKTSGYYKIKANEYWSLRQMKQGYLVLKDMRNGFFRVENFGNKSIQLGSVHRLQNLYFTMTDKKLTIETSLSWLH